MGVISPDWSTLLPLGEEKDIIMFEIFFSEETAKMIVESKLYSWVGKTRVFDQCSVGPSALQIFALDLA